MDEEAAETRDHRSCSSVQREMLPVTGLREEARAANSLGEDLPKNSEYIEAG